jgi:hypothetical protein
MVKDLFERIQNNKGPLENGLHKLKGILFSKIRR